MKNTVATRRFKAEIRELTLGESIELAKIPDESEHASTAKLLGYIVTTVSGAVTSIDDWTVQERNYVKAMYMSATRDDGPNFLIDEESGAVLTDYMAAEQQYPNDSVEIDGVVVHQLTGRLAESIERLSGELEATDYGHWLAGWIAATSHLVGEEYLPPAGDSDLDDWLLARMKELFEDEGPMSGFEHRAMVLMAGQIELSHLLNLVIAPHGGIALAPKEAEAELPLARFPTDTILSVIAKRMGGKLRKND